jgi:hypothetical protein
MRTKQSFTFSDMKITRTFILAGAALSMLLLGGCADGPYYGGGYSGSYYGGYSGPYYGGYGPYGGDVIINGGYYGGHHFYGSSFGHGGGGGGGVHAAAVHGGSVGHSGKHH